MRLLVDTHAVAWFSLSDPQLSATAAAALADRANEVFVSPASYWEMAIKIHLGKWTIGKPYADLVDDLWAAYGFEILPVAPDHTTRLIGLPDHHNDPFDRLIAVQALAENLTLVSKDAVFDLYGVPRIWA